MHRVAPGLGIEVAIQIHLSRLPTTKVTTETITASQCLWSAAGTVEPAADKPVIA